MSAEYSDYQDSRAVPSVSRDRWLEHARKKLEKGYALIVSDERRNANFYMAGKGYESCAHKTAVQLIKQGVVTKAGKHHLGTLYLLSADAVVVDEPVVRRPVDEDAEEEGDVEDSGDYEDLLDELEGTDDEEEDYDDDSDEN